MLEGPSLQTEEGVAVQSEPVHADQLPQGWARDSPHHVLAEVQQGEGQAGEGVLLHLHDLVTGQVHHLQLLQPRECSTFAEIREITQSIQIYSGVSIPTRDQPSSHHQTLATSPHLSPLQHIFSEIDNFIFDNAQNYCELKK